VKVRIEKRLERRDGDGDGDDVLWRNRVDWGHRTMRRRNVNGMMCCVVVGFTIGDEDG
jgi:hypothetical protein